MRRLAPLIPIVAWATGCGDQPPPVSAPVAVAETPETAVMSCRQGWTFSADKRYFTRNWREEAVTAGPIALLWLNSHADGDFGRPRSIYTKVLVEPHRTTTLAVASEDRAHVSLTSHPPNGIDVYVPGDPAIRFEGCPPREDDTRADEEQGTGYAIAVMLDGPRCATFEITPEGGATMRRRARFGVSACG